MFSGMPAAGGLTRTLIVETSGAKTQVFSLVSSIFVLVVILGLGSLFQELPEVELSLTISVDINNILTFMLLLSAVLPQ